MFNVFVCEFDAGRKKNKISGASFVVGSVFKMVDAM
jgi:hypothetical protein